MRNITKLLTVIFLLWTMVCGLWTTSYAAIPKLINYQGRFSDSQGRPVTATKKMAFRLYDASGGGTLLWESIYDPGLTGSRGVSIDKGVFNEKLGEFNNGNGQYRNLADLPFDKQYYLEIVMEGEVLSPRQLLTSSAYALRANVADEADTVDGFYASQTPAANRIPVLDANAKLPAIDGSQLTNIPLPKVYMVSGTDVLNDGNISSKVTLTASNSTGQKTYITFMGDTHTYNNQVNVSIQVDGVTKATSTVRASDHGDHYIICAQWVESPSAGSHTYRVMSSGGYDGWNGYTWSLVVLII